MKQRNIFGLELIDTGNLVHTSIVSDSDSDSDSEWKESMRAQINAQLKRLERSIANDRVIMK